MAVAQYRVSKSGCLTLPVETRRRWGIAAGGTVEIADLGDAVVVVPTGRGELRSMRSQAIAEADGYGPLVRRIVASEPDLT